MLNLSFPDGLPIVKTTSFLGLSYEFNCVFSQKIYTENQLLLNQTKQT